MDARNALRDVERKKAERTNGFSKFLAGMQSIGTLTKGRALLSKKPLEALAAAEEVLSLNLYSPSGLKLLMDAGKSNETPFIEVEAMELMTEMSPSNESYLNNLADRYKELGDGRNYLKIRQKISALHPDSLELQGALREAAAIATMEAGGWDSNSEQSFAEKIKKTDDKKVDS